MKKVFVDTNILIDLIADRRPFSRFAVEVFDKAEKNKVKLYTSTHIIATTHFLLKKYIGEKELRHILSGLLEFVHLISIDADMIQKGLRSRIKDFEDSLQILAAGSVEGMDYIVTRNLKDFRDSEIEVVPPDVLAKII